MIRRSGVRTFARIVVAALFFAQASIAAAACGMMDRSPAMAFDDEVAMPCHETAPQNRNLCLADCLSADQSASTPHVVVPAWCGTAPLVVVEFGYTSKQVATSRRMVPRAAAPPPRILFQSFLI
jgi:hypothetical protein